MNLTQQDMGGTRGNCMVGAELRSGRGRRRVAGPVLVFQNWQFCFCLASGGRRRNWAKLAVLRQFCQDFSSFASSYVFQFCLSFAPVLLPWRPLLKTIGSLIHKAQTRNWAGIDARIIFGIKWESGFQPQILGNAVPAWGLESTFLQFHCWESCSGIQRT